MPTVITADKQPLIAFALAQLLRSEPDFTLVAQCSTTEQTLVAVRAQQPDLLVIDPDLPQQGGLAVAKRLCEEASPTRVVFLAEAIDGEALLEAMRWQVRGVVLQKTALQLLLPCLHKVYTGGEWLERDAVSHAFEHILRQGEKIASLAERLTPRELSVVQWVAAGYSNKTIARQFASTEGAVKAHLHRIYQKLAIRNRVELVQMFQHHEETPAETPGDGA